MGVVLSIALMVSNRRDTIQKCLDSLTPIRQQVSCQLILLDTGCDADVRQLLEQYGDVVADFSWCGDFSRARNETLKYAVGEWYMYLDDDEWFVDVQELVDFFVSGEYRQYGCASYIQRNYLDMGATQYTDSWVSRMSRRWPGLHFVSKIHEYMEPIEGNCKGLRAIVDHFGYVYETQEALWKHFERNVPLLQEMIAEEPDNLRWRIQLAQEYRSVKENEKLYALGEECLALSAHRDGLYDNIALGGFYGARVIARREQGRYEEVLALCREAEEDKRNTELCRAFLALNAARACFYLKRYAEGEKKAAEYLHWKDFFAENEPILYLQKPVPFVGECLDLVMIKEGYSLLICCGLMQGDVGSLEKYLDKLEWREGHVYVFEEIVPTLVRAMCEMPRQAIFETVLHVMHGHSGLWSYFGDCLAAYEHEGGCVTPVMEMIRKVAPDALMGEEKFGSALSRENSREIEELAAGIRGQLRQLIDSGMKEQAAQVLAQVRRLLPEDEELLAMEREIQKLHSDE